jgi:aminoglycoside phosphotransferase (APT) family kinase protein
MIEAPDITAIRQLLAAAGLPQEFEIHGLPGGGNNRVYRLDCRGTNLLLKAYFHHPDDPRDRLDAEFSFSRFAWDHGVRCIPRPLGRDDAEHLGLYEFIDGRGLAAGEIGPGEVDQAAALFAALNRHKSAPDARSLANGSEACFTFAEHLECVARRVVRLLQVEGSDPDDRAAVQWIRERLHPAWQRMEDCVRRGAADSGFALHEPLPAADRCLSPSDFGFHNAILAADNRLRFVDFEYAGWDDPAKAACDFLCQPKLPVPEPLAGRFTEGVVAGTSDAALHRRRIALLLPVYRLKWCCIMMNEFLPSGSRRRNFAQEGMEESQRKRIQLEKADEALQHVEN